MFIHPQFDPIALSLGPISIKWYGLMYVVGFLAFLWLGKRRANQPNSLFKPEHVDDMMLWGVFGVVAGGRLGYMLFYRTEQLFSDPLSLFKIWEGGMSFHGGLIGVAVVMVLLAKHWQVKVFQVSDFIAPLVPIGLGAGRIGNFINAELWGKTTDVPWAVVFPNVDQSPRHPSQLYEAFLEGAVLFIILYWLSQRSLKPGTVTACFLIGYGLFRFIVEFYRTPDPQQLIAIDWLSKGQLLSLPMILIGLSLAIWVNRKNR